MELQFLTPTEVWEGFNPVKDPTETSIISSSEKDNTVEEEVFFTSETTASGKLRVYVKIWYDRRWKDDRPVVIVIPSLLIQKDYSSLIGGLMSEGYVVALLDYAGFNSDGPARTSLPACYSFTAYPECNDNLFALDGDARSTPWFIWSKIVRRTITMLSENHPVDSSRIALMGIGEGAQIGWITAGMDGRVTSLIAINGGGYLWRTGTPRFIGNNFPENDSERVFSTGVGAETYARFIPCPVCYAVSSNSEYADVDRAGDIISLVPAESKALMISKSSSFQITRATFNSILKWMQNNFAHNAEPSEIPSLYFEQIEGRLYLKLKTEKTVNNMSVYVSYGEPIPALRLWKDSSVGQKVGKHEYTFSVPVFDCGELVVAYAEINGTDGITVCSPVIGIIPSKIGVHVAEASRDAQTRIVYNGTMGTGFFTAVTDELLLEDGLVVTKDGPFEIKGVCTLKGDLVFNRSANETFSQERDAVFRFDAYSPTEATVTIKCTMTKDRRNYLATVKLDGGEFWQKINLTASDFKCADGKTLSVFSDSKRCVFSGAQDVLFNNMLWI